MSFSFPVVFHNNHILAKIDENSYALIDTGSHVTMSRQNEERYFGPHSKEFFGAASQVLDHVCEHIHHPVHFLIGNDVMKKYITVITASLITFHPYKEAPMIPDNAIKCPLERASYGSMPLVNIKIGGKSCKFFFDTGAQISYVSKEIAECHESVSLFEDFHPTVGKFVTPVHMIPFEIGNAEIVLRFGLLPPALGVMLSLAPNCSGILGIDLLHKYDTLCLTNNALCLFNVGQSKTQST